MSTAVVARMATPSFRAGLLAEVWAGDLEGGCRIRGVGTTSAPTKNIITHADTRHVGGTGAHLVRGGGGSGRDEIWFGPGQSINLILANAQGASNDHGAAVRMGLKAYSPDGSAKTIQLGQSTPGLVSQTITATDWASIGSAANAQAAWTFNSTSATLFKDAGNPKDWHGLAGGPYVFRIIISRLGVTAADVSFTATATDNLIAEIAAQMVTLLNTALNTHAGTSGVVYAAYSSSTNAITVTNTAISGNPALALGQFTVTATVHNASAVEVPAQFHLITHQSSSTTAALTWRMPPDFKLVVDHIQLYRVADLTAGALPDYTTESRQGHFFANYGFTNALSTGGAGKYLDNDAGVARGWIGAAATFAEITVQVMVDARETTTANRFLLTGISDDEAQAVASSTFSIQSYQDSELAITPDQGTARETGLVNLGLQGVVIVTYSIRTQNPILRQLFLGRLSVLENHEAAPWPGMTIKDGFWLNANTGSYFYDPTTGYRSRVYAARVWNRGLTDPEREQSIADWEAQAAARGIVLSPPQPVTIYVNADSTTAWRSADSHPYQAYRDEDLAGMVFVNTANGASGYAYPPDNPGGENVNNNSEAFVATETRRGIPAIEACRQSGANFIVVRADGINNIGELVASGFPAYKTRNTDVSRARIIAAAGGCPGFQGIVERDCPARGGRSDFETPRLALNADRRTAQAAGTIAGIGSIEGTLLDSVTEATAAMTTGSTVFSTDGIHMTAAGQTIFYLAIKPFQVALFPINYALREDAGFALREDGGFELRE